MIKFFLVIFISVFIYSEAFSQTDSTNSSNSENETPEQSLPRTTTNTTTITNNSSNETVEVKSETKTIIPKWYEHVYMSFGSTFDFKSGIRPNEFYADAMAGSYYLSDKKYRDIRNSSNANGGQRKIVGSLFSTIGNALGFHAGLYHLETTTLSDSTSEKFRLVDKIDDTLRFISVNSFARYNVSLRSVCFFMEPKIRIREWDRTNTPLTAYFGFAYRAEYQNSLYKYNTNRVYSNFDTTLDPPSDWPRPYNTIQNLPNENELSAVQQHNLFLAPGLVLMYPYSAGYVEAKFFLGNRITLFMQNDTASKANDPFYLFRFTIHETKKAGIKIGTDIRGPWIKNSDIIDSKTLKTKLPFISVYLAKEFDMEKLASFLTP